ncbi:hypothetical protein TNIN_141691 [Trichonephila inaurata madagascariensis]|uniref:Uncharacterized protein n=1 Tax=Trichonephila inaurata madagascariensis TaxID=2747483 RepID=A0A8X6XFN8_9ARAC|nr:hypothetical protein TNIN_141691 [Trichonephila inaurata madagascariensis]
MVAKCPSTSFTKSIVPLGLQSSGSKNLPCRGAGASISIKTQRPRFQRDQSELVFVTRLWFKSANSPENNPHPSSKSDVHM